MKTYELIVERLRPSCGGQDPKDVQIFSVITDDPMAYVRRQEPVGELEQTQGPAGEIIISLDKGLKHIRYTFAED